MPHFYIVINDSMSRGFVLIFVFRTRVFSEVLDTLGLTGLASAFWVLGSKACAITSSYRT